MKKIIFLFCLISFSLFAQEKELSFIELEEYPSMPACEEVNRDYKKDCFNLKMQQHIKKHFKYPKKALRKGISGRVMITFVINKEGNIENITTTGAHEILMKEAKRIVSLLPKFKPGYLNGEPVKVQYGLPITFRLTK